jgi:UDP:flavonoid glycosyltransferase YjiC (YdhE family)
MVLVPVAADQPANAERCEAAGVGVVVRRDAQDAVAVREALDTVLGDPRFAEAAQRVRREIEEMPAPEAVVRDLERLVEARSAGVPGRIED